MTTLFRHRQKLEQKRRTFEQLEGRSMLSVSQIGSDFEAGLVTDVGASIDSYEKVCIDQQSGNILVAWLGDQTISWRQMNASGSLMSAGSLPLGEEEGIPFAAFDVTSLADGSFVIVWVDQAPPEEHIYSYRIGDLDISPLDASLGVAADTAPSVAACSDGTYVVAWTGDDYNVHLGHYSASGALIDDDLVQVNAPNNGFELALAIEVGVQDDGDVSVFFMRTSNGITASGAFIRHFSSSLASPTGEFELAIDLAAADMSGTRGGFANSTSSAFDADGNLVVTWLTPDPMQFGNTLLEVQRFAPNGIALSTQVNIATGDSLAAPEVAVDSNGGFVVIWVNDDATPTVEGEAFDSSGVSQGSIDPPISLDVDYAYEPVVAIRGDEFVVVWSDEAVGIPLGNAQLHAQRYTVMSAGLLGDLDDDGDVDDHDIDILWSVIRYTAGDTTRPYQDDPNSDDDEDLNGDGYLNEDDVDYMLANLIYIDGQARLNIQYGDADLDGGVGGLDYTAWRNRLPGDDPLIGPGWRNGDWDGDGSVGGLDYTLWRTRPTQYPGLVGPHA